MRAKLCARPRVGHAELIIDHDFTMERTSRTESLIAPVNASPPAPTRKKLWDGGPTTAAVHDAAAAQAGRDAAKTHEATERERAVAAGVLGNRRSARS